MEKIDKILEENLTEISFRLWKALKEKIPDIWSRSSSSTGKYHRRKDGTVPSIAEHVLEMLVSCIKLLSIFNLKPKTLDSDILLLSIVLHDSFKYNVNGTDEYTTNKHDQIIGDAIRDNKEVFMRVFSGEQVNLLEKLVRFHSGRWSSDSLRNFKLGEHSPQILFIHILDMLSTNALLCAEESYEQGSNHERRE
jgi:23S rRNA maturation-related 3'-5' exoribonuclease YhaM